MKKTLSFVIIILALIFLFFYAVKTGSLTVTYKEILDFVFFRKGDTASIVFDLRFPRIFIAMIGGASLAVSGVLFQSVLKNPLADPGIIGITAGAKMTSTIIVAFFPMLFFLTPAFAFLGGCLACGLVYALSFKSGFSPLRIILIGIAVNAFFVGLNEVFSLFSGGGSTASSMVGASISMKTWNDVHFLTRYALVGLALSLFTIRMCNLMVLDDNTVRGLGVNVMALRIIVSLVACLLASVTTAVVGSISFLGLIVPHIGRLCIGSNHKYLIPFSMFLGAFTLLLADTMGRLIVYPYEIPAGVIMSIIGGPFFILLLKRGDKRHGC